MSRSDSTDSVMGSSELSTGSQARQLPRVGLWTCANLVLIRVLIWACLLCHTANFNESLRTLKALKSHSNLISFADRHYVLRNFFLPMLLYVADKDEEDFSETGFFPHLLNTLHNTLKISLHIYS